jgi:hypothetical protein
LKAEFFNDSGERTLEVVGLHIEIGQSDRWFVRSLNRVVKPIEINIAEQSLLGFDRHLRTGRHLVWPRLLHGEFGRITGRRVHAKKMTQDPQETCSARNRCCVNSAFRSLLRGNFLID